MQDIIAQGVLLLFLATSLAVTATLSEETPLDERIVGGQIINVNQAPYIVRLKHINGDHWCGGTLVTLQHVVTAAHCLDFVDPIKELWVVAGVSTLDELGQQRYIINYDKAAAYSRSNFHMDYAVLKLNSPLVQGPNTRPINLRSNSVPPGSIVYVSGFGRQVGGGQISHHLRTIALPVITNEVCAQSYTLTNTMFCTAVAYKGPCQYDSGGPVFYNGELCGIVSWGRSDCDYSGGSPAVFTSIDKVLTHIQKAIKTL